jgi:hypothetical protein
LLDDKIKEAIVAELTRQSADCPSTIKTSSNEGFYVEGRIDLDALAAAIAGSVAGGP